MPPSEERRVSSAYRVQYVWCVRRGVGVTRPVRVARLGSCFQFTTITNGCSLRHRDLCLCAKRAHGA